MALAARMLRNGQSSFLIARNVSVRYASRSLLCTTLSTAWLSRTGPGHTAESLNKFAATPIAVGVSLAVSQAAQNRNALHRRRIATPIAVAISGVIGYALLFVFSFKHRSRARSSSPASSRFSVPPPFPTSPFHASRPPCVPARRASDRRRRIFSRPKRHGDLPRFWWLLRHPRRSPSISLPRVFRQRPCSGTTPPSSGRLHSDDSTS